MTISQMTMSDAKQMTVLNIYSDGGARGNPGPAAAAFIIKNHLGKKITSGGEYLGHSTNNVAEYKGIILALKWLVQNHNQFLSKKQNLNFYLDSKLIVNQLTGNFKIKDSKLKVLFREVKNLEYQLNGLIDYRLIPREKNKDADLLVNEILDNNLS